MHIKHVNWKSMNSQESYLPFKSTKYKEYNIMYSPSWQNQNLLVEWTTLGGPDSERLRQSVF